MRSCNCSLEGEKRGKEKWLLRLRRQRAAAREDFIPKSELGITSDGDICDMANNWNWEELFLYSKTLSSRLFFSQKPLLERNQEPPIWESMRAVIWRAGCYSIANPDRTLLPLTS